MRAVPRGGKLLTLIAAERSGIIALRRSTYLAFALIVRLALPAFAAAEPAPGEGGRSFPTRPLFGDTHLHTSFSMDAGAFGARLTPRDAYQFARGAEITSNTGQPAKLSRPLDFLVVADHSDGMGFFPTLMGGDPTLLATEQGRRWHDQIQGG